MKNLKTFEEFNSYWGTDKQPFWRPSANPTVDILVVKNSKEILLIQRSKNSKACAGMWALPGGFHDTTAKIGQLWKVGKESAKEAAKRELEEETGLKIAIEDLIEVGVYEDMNRDPRNNVESWAKSTFFTTNINTNQKIKGSDDAIDAQWFTIKKVLNMKLAFDHNQLVIEGLKKLGLL